MLFNFVVLGIFLYIVSFFFLRRKNRLIWKKMWQIEKSIVNVNEVCIDIKKNIIANEVNDVRLDRLLPSQHGEDVFLWEFFKKMRRGFFVEIGAHDGVTFSNTYWLESAGWSGILVEPNSKLYLQAKKARPYSKVINCAIGSDDGKNKIILHIPIGINGHDTLSYTKETKYQKKRIERSQLRIKRVEVDKMTMRELLYNINDNIDVLSIDVEGAELDVLRGHDWKNRRPKIIIIEDNSNGMNTDVPLYLNEHGYTLINRIGCNVIFCNN